MESDDAICQILKGTFFHTHLLHHLKQLFLGQESFDWFNKVLVAGRVVGDDLPHFRDYVEWIFTVYFFQYRILHFWKLQTHETSSGF